MFKRDSKVTALVLLLFVFVFPLSVFSQHQISGKVTSVANQPLEGISVIVKETKTGTVTDVNGSYSLKVNDTAKLLEFSMVGYVNEERKIGNENVINVTLFQVDSGLDEVVVIGYGTMQKQTITGAVASISSKDIESYANSNFDQAIVGKLAGVNVLTNARNPGDGNTITIRGAGSITRGTDPLVVVDGFPLAEGSSLNMINPNDIESIDVIKDAASSAIYGSRAANGLIMITTKKGRNMKPTVQVSSVVGFQERTGTYDLLNAYDAAVFFAEGRNNAYLKNRANANINDTEAERRAKGANVRELLLGYTIPYLNKTPGLTDFDWEDAVYRRGGVQNHYVNISGARERTNYSASVGYTNEEGIVITSSQKKVYCKSQGQYRYK